MGHLIGRVAQLEIALLLHPVDEFLVHLRIGAEQLLLDCRILDHDEVPGLAVGARHGPASRLQNLADAVVRDRIGLELAHAGTGADQIHQHVVVGNAGIGLAHRVASSGVAPLAVRVLARALSGRFLGRISVA
jgi:hypothetical protein